MIKEIIIDMGGVCFELGTERALKRMSSIMHLPVDELEKVFGGREKGKEGYLYRRGKLTREEFWDAAAKKLGIKSDIVPEIEEIWHSSYEPIEGMMKLIAELSRDYKLIVFSGNIKERVEYLDRKHDFKRYFQDFVFSYDYGVSKEDIEFYDALVSKLGCRPSEAVVVDDVPKFLEMAKSKGLNTIKFESAEQLRAELKNLGVNI